MGTWIMGIPIMGYLDQGVSGSWLSGSLIIQVMGYLDHAVSGSLRINIMECPDRGVSRSDN